VGTALRNRTEHLSIVGSIKPVDVPQTRPHASAARVRRDCRSTDCGLSAASGQDPESVRRPRGRAVEGPFLSCPAMRWCRRQQSQARRVRRRFSRRDRTVR
jgi:hypothetical protein